MFNSYRLYGKWPYRVDVRSLNGNPLTFTIGERFVRL